MTEAKTVPTDASVEEFLARAEPAGRREDAVLLKGIMDRITGVEAVMWGPSIIGYGSVHYRYETGREGDMPAIAFSPRKASMSLYGLQFDGSDDLLDRLGKHKRGAGCVWVGRLTGLDQAVLEQLITSAWKHNS